MAVAFAAGCADKNDPASIGDDPDALVLGHIQNIRDWAAAIEISAGQMGCYVPPCATRKWLDRFAFMEAAGDRWWPIAGGVFYLQAIKRVRGMRIIMPAWSDKTVPKKALAPAPKKVRQPEDAVAARNGVNARASHHPGASRHPSS